MKILIGMSCSDTKVSGSFKHICRIGEKFRQEGAEAVYAIGSNGEVIEKTASKEAHKNYIPMQADDAPATFVDLGSLKEEVGFKADIKIEYDFK